jgi:hypothetical protein
VREWKARTGYVDPRRPKPYRNASQRRRRRPDLRISYRKLVAALEEDFEGRGLDAPFTRARQFAKALLTPAQRERALEEGLL